MFSKLRNYIKQEETKIYYRKNKLDIINYKKILIFEDNKILVEIIDDILDVTGSQEVLGKPIGSDSLQNKHTFVTLFGLDGAKSKAEYYTNKALNVLDSFQNNDFLVDLTNSLLVRNY